MSTLVSPGVSITVQNDSFYAAAGNGSVPLVVFASAQDKLVPGTSATIAAGTQKANAGKLYLMTSQRDVLQTFGAPVFQEEDGTIVQGDELNEYGLHGLFSALGITSRAYAVRADIDLQEIEPTQVEPRGTPDNQTLWLDVANTDFGLFVHNGGTFGNQILNWDKVSVSVPTLSELDGNAPAGTFGAIGDYAVVPYNAGSEEITTVTTLLNFYRKDPTGWVSVSPDVWQATTAPSGVAGNMWVKTDSPAGGMDLDLSRYVAGQWEDLDVVVGGSALEVEALLGELQIGSYAYISGGTGILRTDSVAETSAGADFSAATSTTAWKVSYTTSSHTQVQTLEYTGADADAFVTLVNTNTSMFAEHNTDDSTVSIRSLDGRAFTIEVDGVVTNSSTNWVTVVSSLYASLSVPTNPAEDGRLWYDDSLYADIMVNAGGKWVSMETEFPGADVQFRQEEPTSKSSGATLDFGDVWIDPADGTDYMFYQYQGDAMGWMLLDSTDQSTTRGVLFADMRQSDENGVSFFTHSALEAKTALMNSDYVDPTCPDPRMYPAGMLAVNLQQTGGVVRKAVHDAFVDIAFDEVSGEFDIPGDAINGSSPLASVLGNARWVTESGLETDGSAKFGREAQRKVVVEAMAASLMSETLRSETIEFNILACPGYVEMLDELVTLNVDRRETAYIVTDVPARLAPMATDVNNWAQNVNNAPTNGSQGRITGYDYAAQYMGWGLGTNVDGSEVVIPGSSIALRTYLYNDSVAYVWFPPAGAERGVVTNASSIGYIDAEGEYAPQVYNKGQRDAMYTNKINPIAMRPNRGLLVFGDKSLSPSVSALDRVNVGRLVVYIRTEIEKIAERFLFKLNTPRVRDEFAAALTAFLANIVQLEGLQDFAVVCDTSNNTPLRIDRNELWADIAIQPTKSINFVYVPIRIQNTEG